MNEIQTRGKRNGTHRSSLLAAAWIALLLGCGVPASMQAEDRPAVPGERLTAEYLQGSWCSVYGGQETTEWAFDAEGSYRIGVPAGSGYAMQPEVRSLEHFRDRFESVVEMEPDTFTTLHRHGRKNVFTRGPCQ